MPKPGNAAAVRAVRAEAGARIGAARAALAAPPTDTSVHAVRRELKRARALLRILRAAVGSRAVRHADCALRDIGRDLGVARDPAQLAAQLRTTAAAAGLKPAAVRVLLDRFAAERRAALKPVDTRRVSADLARIARSVARLPARGDESALAIGFARIYRQAREGYLRACDAPLAEELHGWRRHTKRYWHALELLRPAKPRVIHTLARKAHRLADALGTDHDLALLEVRLAGVPLAYGVRRRLSTALASGRRDAQAVAFALGAELYDEGGGGGGGEAFPVRTPGAPSSRAGIH